MELRYDVVKGQKFDIGRTINPLLCDCLECSYLNCPRKNYVPKTKVHKYTTKEFINQHSNELKATDCFTKELADEYVGSCFNFPKGLYYYLIDAGIFNKDERIALQAVNRRGEVITKATIDICDGNIREYDLSERQYRFAHRLADGIREVNTFIKG